MVGLSAILNQRRKQTMQIDDHPEPHATANHDLLSFCPYKVIGPVWISIHTDRRNHDRENYKEKD